MLHSNMSLLYVDDKKCYCYLYLSQTFKRCHQYHCNFHHEKSLKDHTNIYTSTTATPVHSKSIPTSGVTKDTSGSKSVSDSGDKFDIKYQQMKEASSSNLVDAENCPKTEPNWSAFKKVNKKKTKLLVPVKG